MKKKVVSMLLVATMVASMAGCNNGGEEAPTQSSQTGSSASAGNNEASTYELTSLKMMVNGTLAANEENYRDEFEKQWEEAVSAKIGHAIDLEINQVDHSGYVDAVGRAFASGDYPDVIILSADQYAQYANTGLLWDMTEAYENADFQSRMDLAYVNETMKIDGRLYGLAPATGNGCVTWVKKTWLDAVGLKAEDIKDWDSYYDMLTKFAKNDPDGNGVNDTYGVAAAGFIGFEAPYINYLPEFWQDAYPAFYQDESGQWIDGFDTQATKDALLRLQKAYNDGVIDPESLTMGTSDVRKKFWGADQAGSAGVFTYWAGKWKQNVIDNFKTNELMPADGNVDDYLVSLPPIAEVGTYLNREAPMWCIIDDGDGDSSREQAIFNAFCETMLDGDTVQILWTYGPKGFFWDDKAETVTLMKKDGDNLVEGKVTEYQEGEFHMLPQAKDPTKAYASNHIDPTLVIAHLTNEDLKKNVTDIMAVDNKFFMDHQRQAPKSATSETLTNEGGTINDAKTKVVTEVVTKNGDVDAAMAEYESTTASLVAQVLAELNAQ